MAVASAHGDRLWSPKELAEYLGIPVNTLYRWRTYGKGPPAVRIGVHTRYRVADVESWLAARREQEE